MLFTYAADPYPLNQVYYVRMYSNRFFEGHLTIYRYIAHLNDKSLGYGFKVKG